MDYVAITGTNYFLRRRKKGGRLFAAALLFSLASLILVLLVQNFAYYRILTHFLLNTLMVYVCFGRCSRKAFLENWMVTYLIVVVLGGLMEWLQESSFVPPNFLVQALLASAAVFFAVTWLMQHKTRTGHIFPAEIKKDNRRMDIHAYWDSGNQLRDPYTGSAVNILGFTKAKEFLDTGSDKIRYVPYRSLGEENGLLRVTNIDELIIYKGKTAVRISPAAVGIANEGLLEGKEYDLILHASLLEN